MKSAFLVWYPCANLNTTLEGGHLTQVWEVKTYSLGRYVSVTTKDKVKDTLFYLN